MGYHYACAKTLKKCSLCRAPVKSKKKSLITQEQIEEAKLFIKNRNEPGFDQMLGRFIISDEVRVTFIEEALKDNKEFDDFFTSPAMQLSSTSHVQPLIDRLKSSRDYHSFSSLVCFC